jgi:hypothetical protein
VPTFDPFGWGLMFTIDPGLYQSNYAFAGANRCAYMRITGGGVITKIGLFVGTSSGNISLAVYGQSGIGRSCVPNGQKVTTGAISCPAGSTYTEVSLGASVGVVSGDYFALSCDNTTATFGGAMGAAYSHALAAGRVGFQGTAHPAPSSPSLASGGERCFVLVGVA